MQGISTARKGAWRGAAVAQRDGCRAELASRVTDRPSRGHTHERASMTSESKGPRCATQAPTAFARSPDLDVRRAVCRVQYRVPYFPTSSAALNMAELIAIARAV